MDARTFLGLEPTSNPLVWRMPITPGVSTPGQFLFGGCGLAAAVATMEEVTGRPTVWATGQYLSYGPTGTILDIEVTVAVAGHQTTQARAVGRVDGKEILTVNSALGRRPSEQSYTWAVRPDVPGPDGCPVREPVGRFGGTIFDRVEIRLASGRQFDQLDGTSSDGRSALWSRLPGQLEPSASWLAVLGDYVPSGVAQALGAILGRQQPRQHPPGGAAGPERVGALRHPDPGRRQRVRTRLGPPVGRGWQPARHRQSIGCGPALVFPLTYRPKRSHRYPRCGTVGCGAA